MLSHYCLTTESTDEDDAMIERIRSKTLRAWVFETSRNQPRPELFMTQVCNTLRQLQTQGRISGFEESNVGGVAMPIVSRVKLNEQWTEEATEAVASAGEETTRFFGRPGLSRIVFAG